MTEEQKKQQQEQQAAVQPIQPTAPTTTAATPQQQEQGEAYASELDKLLQAYDRQKADDARADRRSRVSEAIAGIGDVARAVSDLYHTTRYAPYVPADNMSDNLRTRNDRLTALRDKNRDQWMHYVLNVAGKKEQARQADRARKDTQAYRDATLAETKRHHNESIALQKEKLEQQKALQKERNELQRQRNEITKIKNIKVGSGRGAKVKPIPVYDEDGSIFNIPGDQDVKIALATVYGFIPEEERYKYDTRDHAKAIGTFLSDPDANNNIKGNMREALKVLARLEKQPKQHTPNGKRDWNNNGKRNW